MLELYFYKLTLFGVEQHHCPLQVYSKAYLGASRSLIAGKEHSAMQCQAAFALCWPYVLCVRLFAARPCAMPSSEQGLHIKVLLLGSNSDSVTAQAMPVQFGPVHTGSSICAGAAVG